MISSCDIRQAAPTDAIQIAQLVTSLAHFYLDKPQDKLPAWLSETLTEGAFAERLSSNEYRNTVYLVDGKIVGYISIKNPSHLYHLFVSEQYQGKGIARLLWNHVLKTDQYSTMTVRSSKHAIPVYKQLGFVESAPIGVKDGISFQPMVLKF